MPAKADRTFPAPADTPTPDRPLTVPLLVRGGFDNRLIVWLVVSGGGCFMAGVFTLLLGGHVPAGVFWLIAAAFGVLALWRALWLLPQRRWLEVTLTGFGLTRRGRKCAFGDGDVVGLSRGAGVPMINGTQQHVVLELLDEGRRERLDCTYTVPLLPEDPLQAFWHRLAVHLARRTLKGLARAGLEGSDWSIDAAGLHHGGRRGRTCPLERLTKAGVFDRRLCVWKDADERPFLRLRAEGRNVYSLGLLLQELIRAGPETSKPRPDAPLGRVLFERRGRGWAAGLSLVLLGLLFAAVGLLAAWDTGKGEFFYCLVAAMLAGCGLGVYLMGRHWWMRLVVHEFGLSQPTWGEDRRLHYAGVGTLTWRGEPFMARFAPLGGPDRAAIDYNPFETHAEDEDLAALRDHVARVIASRWDEERRRGPVQWTTRLRFLPEGLEYRAKRPGGAGEPAVVPYGQLRYRLAGGWFFLYRDGSDQAVFTQKTTAANFFPGLMLLLLIRESTQDPAVAARAPVPREWLAGRGRFGVSQGRGRLTTGEDALS